jgi:N-methylhydantoinase B
VQYELPAGAIGARYDRDGVSASKVHVANGSLTPIEVLETEFPVRLNRFELVPDSGGPGRFRGGLGYVREYQILGESRFTTRNGRELTPPAGRDGGLPGTTSLLVLNPGRDGEREIHADDGQVLLGPGDVLSLGQAGGGGYGDPATRPAAEVLADVREGYVSPAAAREHYQVIVRAAGGGWELDEAATSRLRSAVS